MIRKTYTFKAPVEDVWDALTDPHMILAWSGYPAQMSAQPGANFSLWEGTVHGTNIEVVPHKKLVQNWYGGDWEAPSLVTMTLSGQERLTTIELEHTGIPPEEKADFASGWDDYYMLPIKQLLEPEKFPRQDPAILKQQLSDQDLVATFKSLPNAPPDLEERLAANVESPPIDQPPNDQPPSSPPSTNQPPNDQPPGSPQS